MKLEDGLRRLRTTSKARRLQSLWPAIEAKLAEGVPHAEILRLLNETGFALTERTYKSCLYRDRKLRRSRGPERAPTPLAEPKTSPRTDVAPAVAAPAPVEAERHPRPPSFDYDPRGLSPELLK